jgi:hypothetical protein
LLLYILYLILLIPLLQPTRVSFGKPYYRNADHHQPGRPAAGPELSRTPPRILYYANSAIDSVIREAQARVSKKATIAPFEWERIAYTSANARIRDPSLFWTYRAFLEQCHTPLMARTKLHESPLHPANESRYGNGDLLITDNARISCRTAVSRFRKLMLNHVRSDPVHAEIVRAAEEYDGGEGFAAAYAETISLNEWHLPNLIGSESGRVRQSLGSFEAYELPVSGPNDTYLNRGKALLGAFGTLSQEWKLTQEPHQRYFLVVLFAPHIYGFTLFFLLSLFPFIAAWSVAPSGWKALGAYARIFLATKLWPVLWTALSHIGSARKSIEAANLSPGMINMSDVWIVAVSMFLLVPLISYMLIHITGRAAGAMLSMSVPGPAGAVSAVSAGRMLMRRGSRQS